MKRHLKQTILTALLAVLVLALSGLLSGAGADTVYTDSRGEKYKVVPLGGGLYELWKLVTAPPQSIVKTTPVPPAPPKEESVAEPTQNPPQEESAAEPTQNPPQEESAAEPTQNPPQETEKECDHKGYERFYRFPAGGTRLVHDIYCANCSKRISQESCSLEITAEIPPGENPQVPEGGSIRTCRFCHNSIIVSKKGIMIDFVSPPQDIPEEVPEESSEEPSPEPPPESGVENDKENEAESTPNPPEETVAEATQNPPQEEPEPVSSEVPPPEEQTAEGEKENKKECEHLITAWGSEGISHPQFHWEECLVCGKTLEPMPHVYDRITVVTPATCKADAVLERKCVCGRVDPDHTAPAEGDPPEYFAHHTWGEYGSDYLNHWQICTACGERSEPVLHTIVNLKADREPDCIRDGRASYDCEVCGEHFALMNPYGLLAEKYPQLKQFRALGHDFSGELKPATGPNKCSERDQGTHAASCVRCGTADYSGRQPHSWAEYTISNGTCEDPDDPVVIGGTCACGATLELKYERHHSYVKDSSRDVQPTCTEPGKLNGERCVFCGAFGNYDFTEPLGHEMVDDSSREPIPPTCTEKGTVYTKCTRCDATGTRETKTISPKGEHVFVRYAPLGDASVCLGRGSYMMKCKYCDTFQSDDRIQVDKLAHETYEKTRKDGNEMQGTTRDGLPMVGQSWEVKVYCRRCNRHLGTTYRTVWKSMRGNRFQIFRERKHIADDLNRNTGATVVTGQMGRDKGAYFENVVNSALSKEIHDCLKDYDYAE